MRQLWPTFKMTFWLIGRRQLQGIPLCEERQILYSTFPRLFCHPFLLSLGSEVRERILFSLLAPVEGQGSTFLYSNLYPKVSETFLMNFRLLKIIFNSQKFFKQFSETFWYEKLKPAVRRSFLLGGGGGWWERESVAARAPPKKERLIAG